MMNDTLQVYNKTNILIFLHDKWPFHAAFVKFEKVVLNQIYLFSICIDDLYL